MALYNTAVPTGSAAALLSGSGERAITTVIVCNTTAGDLNLSLYAVSAATANTALIVNALIIPAGDTVTFDQEKMVLATGDALHGLASGSGLSATVSTLAV
jgi:pectin methylesterase-like acyl-CoA thioesterase